MRAMARRPGDPSVGKNSHAHLGSVSHVKIPDAEQLDVLTREVNANNRLAYSHAGLEKPPGAVVRGNTLVDDKGIRRELSATVSGAMMGPLSPVAVRSGNGKLVAYNTWQALKTVDAEQSFSAQGIADGAGLGVPSLRVHDDQGKDFLVARALFDLRFEVVTVHTFETKEHVIEWTIEMIFADVPGDERAAFIDRSPENCIAADANTWTARRFPC